MDAVLLSIGVVGSYVVRVFEEVLNRPRYLLAETVDAHPLESASDGSPAVDQGRRSNTLTGPSR